MYWVKVIIFKCTGNYAPKRFQITMFKNKLYLCSPKLILLQCSKSVKLLPGSLIGYKPSNSIHLYPTSWNHAPINVLKYYCICLLLVSSPTSSALPGCFPHCNRSQLTVAQNWPCQICSTWRVEGANCKTRKPETLDRKLETKRP